MLKIISGKFKNKTIKLHKETPCRPSTNLLREALFNIIFSNHQKPIEECDVLDLFCGSGSFGLEALSRNAKSVEFIDINKKQLNLIEEFLHEVNQHQNKTTIICCDVKQSLPLPKIKKDIIFIDPPYFQNLSEIALSKLHQNKYLNEEALVIIELHLRENINIPENYQLIKKREYRNSKILVLNYTQLT